jgi:outer membrane protein
MKTRWIIVLAFLAATFTANAQDGGLKIGYTNPDYILSNMPEAKQIQSDLKVMSNNSAHSLKPSRKTFRQKIRNTSKICKI